MTPAELYAKRKWHLYIIQPEDILKVLTGEIKITGIPENAVLADCGYRIDAQGIALLTCHDSFPEVPLNSVAPMTALRMSGGQSERG